MRLIDADKILQKTWDVEIKDMFHMTETVEVVSAIDIEEAPTINAIPIVWLDMFMQRYKIEGGNEYALLHFMATEWKKWVKENDR